MYSLAVTLYFQWKCLISTFRSHDSFANEIARCDDAVSINRSILLIIDYISITCCSPTHECCCNIKQQLIHKHWSASWHERGGGGREATRETIGQYFPNFGETISNSDLNTSHCRKYCPIEYRYEVTLENVLWLCNADLFDVSGSDIGRRFGKGCPPHWEWGLGSSPDNFFGMIK